MIPIPAKKALACCIPMDIYLAGDRVVHGLFSNVRVSRPDNVWHVYDLMESEVDGEYRFVIIKNGHVSTNFGGCFLSKEDLLIPDEMELDYMINMPDGCDIPQGMFDYSL